MAVMPLSKEKRVRFDPLCRTPKNPNHGARCMTQKELTERELRDQIKSIRELRAKLKVVGRTGLNPFERFKLSEQERDMELASIAAKHLDVKTLETRNSDELDFYEVSVWRIKEALEAAYNAGRRRK